MVNAICNDDDDGIPSGSDDDRLDSGADISDEELLDDEDMDQNYVYSGSDSNGEDDFG